MIFIRRFSTALIGGALSLLAQQGRAQDSNLGASIWNDDIQFHGFSAQNFIYTDDNSFFGDSENGSFEFWELGINTLWRPLNNLQFAAQAVARDAGKTDDGDIRIDYAFVDYSFAHRSSGTTGVRLGRVVNPLAFYNDTRDIVATRPGILLPQSIYFDVNRNFALSSDGGQLYHEVGNDHGTYTFQLGVFEPRSEDPDFEPAIFFQEVPGKLEGANSWMARILYEYDLGRIRLGLTAAEINVDYNPGTNDPIAPGEFHFIPYILSAQYNNENWSLTAEYARRTTELEKFNGPDVEFTGTSYFVQGTYRFRPTWEVFLRYDELIWNNEDKNGKEFESLTGMPHYSRFAKDWTIGLRWDVSPRVMLRTELHQVNGTGWLSLLENTSSPDTDQNWQLFAMSASFRF
jgi:hypothetical protein